MTCKKLKKSNKKIKESFVFYNNLSFMKSKPLHPHPKFASNFLVAKSNILNITQKSSNLESMEVEVLI